MIQIKSRYCHELIKRTQQITTTHELRQKIQEHLGVPDDDLTPYIAFHKVLDEDTMVEPLFSIVWTSKKLLARVGKEMTQDDATYRSSKSSLSTSSSSVYLSISFSSTFSFRLMWQGYPFFVSGRSTSTGKFFPTHVTLASHEDTEAWKASYNFIKNIAGVTPRYDSL